MAEWSKARDLSFPDFCISWRNLLVGSNPTSSNNLLFWIFREVQNLSRTGRECAGQPQKSTGSRKLSVVTLLSHMSQGCSLPVRLIALRVGPLRLPSNWAFRSRQKLMLRAHSRGVIETLLFSSGLLNSSMKLCTRNLSPYPP